MKVSDVMSRQVDFVTTTTSVRDVARLIFGRGVNGVPVCDGKKVVGFVTERDILEKFYPSMQEFVEDPLHSGDFEAMEQKAIEVFSLSVEKVMSKHPTTVTAETPILRAQSLMFVHKVGRLPVVDGKGNLVGIISKGDIFRAAVGDKLPLSASEEYHDWLSKHYDLVVDWGKRLGHEVPDLTALLKKEKVQNIIDVGAGTGEHDIALAKNGFTMLGLESSKLMSNAAQDKADKLPKEISKRLHFVGGDYIQALKSQQGSYDAAIFMGNALPHLDDNYEQVVKSVSKILQKNALMIFQVVNFEKVFQVKKRFLDFNFANSRLGLEYEHIFLEYYDPPRKKNGPLTLTMAIFDFDGSKWKHRTMNSVSIAHVGKKEITELLEKNGFKDISFYGSMFWSPLFVHPFKPLESDWLNVVARR